MTLPESELSEFCQRWQVAELAAFGSVLRDDFSPHSDIDLVVTFLPESKHSLWDIIAMEEELTAIFQRKVDLGEKRAIQQDPNYIRRKNILNSLQVIYAAR